MKTVPIDETRLVGVIAQMRAQISSPTGAYPYMLHEWCLALERALTDAAAAPIPPALETIHAPKLDPIRVIALDEAPGMGRLIVECYGQAWSNFWNAMGDRTVRQFVASSPADYIADKLHRHGLTDDEERDQADRAYLKRIVEAVQSQFRQAVQERV
jgi:hypothetical protein